MTPDITNHPPPCPGFEWELQRYVWLSGEIAAIPDEDDLAMLVHRCLDGERDPHIVGDLFNPETRLVYRYGILSGLEVTAWGWSVAPSTTMIPSGYLEALAAAGVIPRSALP